MKEPVLLLLIMACLSGCALGDGPAWNTASSIDNSQVAKLGSSAKVAAASTLRYMKVGDEKLHGNVLSIWASGNGSFAFGNVIAYSTSVNGVDFAHSNILSLGPVANSILSISDYSIAASLDGTYVATWVASLNNGNIYIMFTVSEDNGDTWTNAENVVECDGIQSSTSIATDGAVWWAIGLVDTTRGLTGVVVSHNNTETWSPDPAALLHFPSNATFNVSDFYVDVSLIVAFHTNLPESTLLGVVSTTHIGPDGPDYQSVGVSRSIDGGMTFSLIQPLPNPFKRSMSNPVIAGDDLGHGWVLVAVVDTKPFSSLAVAVSSTDGQYWSAFKQLKWRKWQSPLANATYTDPEVVYMRPAPGVPAVYGLIWTASLASGVNSTILSSYSFDGGHTWETPTVVSQEPPGSGGEKTVKSGPSLVKANMNQLVAFWVSDSQSAESGTVQFTTAVLQLPPTKCNEQSTCTECVKEDDDTCIWCSDIPETSLIMGTASFPHCIDKTQNKAKVTVCGHMDHTVANCPVVGGLQWKTILLIGGGVAVVMVIIFFVVRWQYSVNDEEPELYEGPRGPTAPLIPDGQWAGRAGAAAARRNTADGGPDVTIRHYDRQPQPIRRFTGSGQVGLDTRSSESVSSSSSVATPDFTPRYGAVDPRSVNTYSGR